MINYCTNALLLNVLNKKTKRNHTKCECDRIAKPILNLINEKRKVFKFYSRDRMTESKNDKQIIVESFDAK